MERLTMRNGDGTVSQPTNTTVESVFYRLAKYEDTGLTPEEVAELAKIVRCKDCKHYAYYSGEDRPHWCYRGSGFSEVKENGFCSYGEKKGE